MAPGILTILIVATLAVTSTFGQRNVFLKMSRGVDPVVNRINSQTFSSRTAKLQALRSGLIQNAAQSQTPILSFLKTQSVFNKFKFESYWSTNEIFVSGINSVVLASVQSLFGGLLGGVYDETFASFNTDFVESEAPEGRQGGINYTWGLNKIDVQGAWKLLGNNGNGVIVGGIDTGVRITHEALAASYVGENGWYDPGKKTTEPNDQNGHGTHTMGTTCGSNGIGVAPGAKWVACKGCQSDGCAESDLKKCFEFMLCPTDPRGNNQDCSKTPVVINNSWGGNIRSPGYLEVVKTWRSAGIIPVFANGNTGPFCTTAASPAYLDNVLGVGSTTINDQCSTFSSKGPVGDFFGFGFRIKPDLAAPGSDVHSAWFDGDASYKTISGTSMAAPHVTGVVALMFAANPNLTYDEVKTALQKGCTTKDLKAPLIQCQLSIGYKYPNNEFGSGLTNARNSVDLVL